MTADHSFVRSLNDAQVFEMLRYLGEMSKKNPPQGKAVLSSISAGLSDAPPSADVSRLLLHSALEEKGELQQAAHAFLAGNEQRLMDAATDTVPVVDPTGWDQAAGWILLYMHEHLRISWQQQSWKVACSAELQQVTAIRDWIDRAARREEPIRVKNIVSDSRIKAGGDVHIGDVHHHHNAGQPAISQPRTPSLLKISAVLVVFVIVALAFITKCSSCGSSGSIKTLATSSEVVTPPDTLIQPLVSSTTKDIPPVTSIPLPKSVAARLSGMLTDVAGAPLEGVQISAVGLKSKTFSGADGQFDLQISEIPTAHELRLHFFKKGYQPWEEIFFENPKLNIRITLQPENQ